MTALAEVLRVLKPGGTLVSMASVLDGGGYGRAGGERCVAVAAHPLPTHLLVRHGISVMLAWRVLRVHCRRTGWQQTLEDTGFVREWPSDASAAATPLCQYRANAPRATRLLAHAAAPLLQARLRCRALCGCRGCQ